MFSNFGRRFAYQTQGPDWEGWTPPWLQRDEWRGPRFFGRHWHHRGPHGHGPWHAPRFFGMHRRRGPFGPGGPFFEGFFGHGGEGRRFFGRGDVKFALLELLQERPMHGYEMMKALEEKYGGFYSPSAGTIYPTLQMLEDRGLVSVSEVDKKKVYSITDEGRAFLTERQKEESAGPPWEREFFGRGRWWSSPEMQALKSEGMEVARLLAIAGRMAVNNPEQLARLRNIIEQSRKELADMIYGASTSEQPKE